MSVAVGIEALGGVALAWDSACTDDTGEQETCPGKGGYVGGGPVGYVAVGTARTDQLVRRFLRLVKLPPAGAPTLEIIKWAETTLSQSLSKLVEKFELDNGVAALFAVRGVLLRAEPDCAVWRPDSGYSAIGSGSSVAFGALHCSSDAESGCSTQRSAVSNAKKACKAACAHNAFCRPPIHTLWVP